MPATTRPSIVSFALNTLTSAVACAVLLSPAANAAGLGKLTVLSALGQPLRAEIELTAVAPDEAAGLVAKLAPAEAFRQANIDFNPTLLSLRFEVEQRNGRQLIRISSSQAVNEPFVDMLLELNWTGGRLVREYTFLLDPAEMRSTQSAQVAAPVDVPNRNAAPAAAPAAAATSAAAAPAPARAARAPRAAA
ncbi:pilus assembly protein FimV, partial [Rugamonas sp. CCM 8940]|nr:pilus assembly protein FimV [Rugamonas sp. CCM 8940]